MNRYQRLLVLLGLSLVLGNLASCKSEDADDRGSNKIVPTASSNEPVSAAAAEPAIVIEKATLPSDVNATIPLDPKIVHGQLENGLHYYIRPNSMPENRAEFWLSIDVGSFHEDDDQQGLAHFLEHMAFNGTKSFPKNELIAKLESLGVEFGPHLNASTSFDETIYKLRLPTDTPDSVALGMQILSEWASDITLDAEEFEKERGVVLAEKRSRDGAQMRLMQSVITDVFAGTRYANRLPIGIPKVLKKAPLSAIERFYKDWYHPANMAVYVVGDIDAKEIEGMIRERFGGMEDQSAPRKAPLRKQPSQDAFKFLTLQDAELPLTAVALGRLARIPVKRSLSDARAQFVEIIAMVMLGKRLEEAQKRGKARYLMAGGSPVPLLRETEATAFFAMVDPADVEGGLQDLLNEIERARRHGFTASELERANTEIHSIVESIAKEDAENKEQSSKLVEELTRFHLGGDNMIGRPMELALIDHLGTTVKAEEVSTVLQGFLDPEGLIAMSIGAAAKDALSETKVLSLLAALPTASLAAYADEPSNTDLMMSKPMPGSIKEEVHHAAVGVYEWKLSNGATVVLKETDFKNDEILFSATSAGGTSVIDDASALASIRQAAEVVAQGGLGTMDSIALQRALAGRVVSMAPYIGAYSEGLQGSSSVSDLETMLTLAHLYFVSPRKDETAFELYKKNTITALTAGENSPEGRFADALEPWIANKNPRKAVWNKEAAAELNLDDSLAFYGDRMKNAGDFRFTLVGNFKRDEIKNLLLTYIGSLPDDGRREEMKVHAWPSHKARKLVKKRDGSQKRASISMFYDLARPEGMPSTKERFAWDVFASAAQMHYLALFREELGETYSVGVRSRFRDNWSHASLRLGLQVAPERAEAVQKRVESELVRIAKEGVADEYFVKAKEAVIKGHEVDLGRNQFWLESLDSLAFYGKPASDVAAIAKAIDDLSAEDVAAAATAFLESEKPVIGVHLPR
ncbi:MAG: insulinase family protein [Myxococcales bacterium]|nr:insulinase family protein [Myxococcales bacterium]